MQFSDNSSEASRTFLIWQRIAEWAQTHYRDRIFSKDEPIPVRSGLLYLVHQGVVRLVGTNQSPLGEEDNSTAESNSDFPQDNFLGFVSAGQPFEISSQSGFDIQAYAHGDQTQVMWLYWQDLDNWSDFRQEVYESLRSQNQQRLLLLMALGQRKTIDRLFSFLKIIIEEHGKFCEEGYYLPYLLTHAQIGSTIGSTRVTVTRLMGKLRRQGLISIRNDSLICLPHPQSDR
ncbi:MAG: Crp/Fnr family transcriptional regulator [Cyanobacteria bacterium P01_F01_bin.143]